MSIPTAVFSLFIALTTGFAIGIEVGEFRARTMCDDIPGSALSTVVKGQGFTTCVYIDDIKGRSQRRQPARKSA